MTSQVSCTPGQKLSLRSGYAARAFKLAGGESLPEKPSAFDQGAHAPKLVQLLEGEIFEALTGVEDGKVYVKFDDGGDSYACLLLPNSFDIAGEAKAA